MRIQVYSRGAIEALEPPTEPYAIISISTFPSDAANVLLPEGEAKMGFTKLVFADLDRPDPEKAVGMFDDRQAFTVWRLVEKMVAEGVDLLLIHCDAGGSRSPGMAAAIAKILNDDDSEWFKTKTPNMHVYRTMMNKWYDMHPVESAPEPTS